MTDNMTATQQSPAAPPMPGKPATDAEAVRTNSEAVARMRQIAAEIRHAPELHKPKLTLLNLPQLSIMISLQVSANRSQAASDKRAIADHETLIALHKMARQQIDILHGQNEVLALLNQFASKDAAAHCRDN
jgi:hypothetical protein